MSYHIDLKEPEQEVYMPVGQYSNRLIVFWSSHLASGVFNDLNGQTGAYAAPVLTEALVALLQNKYGYSNLPTANEGEYEEAVLGMATLWQACRAYPDFTIRMNY